MGIDVTDGDGEKKSRDSCRNRDQNVPPTIYTDSFPPVFGRNH